MIEQAYYQCEATKSLEDGAYGEGPFKMFDKEKAGCSLTEWVRVDGLEFKRFLLNNMDMTGVKRCRFGVMIKRVRL